MNYTPNAHSVVMPILLILVGLASGYRAVTGDPEGGRLRNPRAVRLSGVGGLVASVGLLAFWILKVGLAAGSS